MSNEGKSSKKASKKDIRDLVSAKLSAALGEFKGLIKEKKFNASIKKASKLFVDDIAKAKSKKAPKPKKASKNKKVQEQPTVAS